MASFVSHTSIDCRDAFAISTWWKGVLDYYDDPDDPNEPDDAECLIIAPDGGPRLLFIEVPESKTGKNRIHLDLRPRHGSRDEELVRLLQHGASEVADRRLPDGRGWVVLADPEGNEFCVLRSESELSTS